MKLFKKICGEI